MQLIKDNGDEIIHPTQASDMVFASFSWRKLKLTSRIISRQNYDHQAFEMMFWHDLYIILLMKGVVDECFQNSMMFALIQLMKDEVDEPIHPTQAFDMIVGTSTGGIISMALLAGKEGKEKESRERLTVDEVKQVYIK